MKGIWIVPVLLLTVLIAGGAQERKGAAGLVLQSDDLALDRPGTDGRTVTIAVTP
jgi:hypothetical protein